MADGLVVVSVKTCIALPPHGALGIQNNDFILVVAVCRCLSLAMFTRKCSTSTIRQAHNRCDSPANKRIL